MSSRAIRSVALCLVLFGGRAGATTVTFTLSNHADNITLLPQLRGYVGVAGDHLVRTADDFAGTTFNPQGCFSFNFMNPIGIWEPDYPPGYAEGIHCMTGMLALDLDLRDGGAVSVASVAFDGYVSPGKYSAQRLVHPGDTAANGQYGPVDGRPNAGSYSGSADANWAFELTLDWFFDTPFAGMGGIDMTFSDYGLSGFIIPVSQLTLAGMGRVTLDDPLGFFGGSSGDFESWLLNEVKPRLPADATYLLFAQGTAHPVWTNPQMGMTTDGLVNQTIVAYATVPEPVPVPEPASAALGLLALGALGVLRRCRR